MTNKFLIQTTIVAFAVLILALVVIGEVSYPKPTTEQVANVPQTARPVMALGGPQTANPLPDEPAPQGEIPVVTLPLASAVSTTDLSNLAHEVHLKNTSLADVDKDEWKRALPKARQLLQGACDCEERNWLNHFVETGNDALTGAAEYENSARFLLTMPKNDNEAMKHTVSD